MAKEYVKSIDNFDEMEDTLMATSLILKNLAKKLERLKNEERSREYERTYQK